MSVVIRFVRGYWCAVELIDGQWLEIAYGRSREYVISVVGIGAE